MSDVDLYDTKYADIDNDLTRALNRNDAVDVNTAAFHSYLYTGAVALVKETDHYSSRNSIHQNKKKGIERKNSSLEDSLLDLVTSRSLQARIDSNIISLRINGKDVEVSQGDLRTAMESRVKDLAGC